jgi:hypothetical protein
MARKRGLQALPTAHVESGRFFISMSDCLMRLSTAAGCGAAEGVPSAVINGSCRAAAHHNIFHVMPIQGR